MAREKSSIPLAVRNHMDDTFKQGYSIRHNFAPQKTRLLLSRGVDHDAFMSGPSKMDLLDVCTKYTISGENVGLRNVSPSKQINDFVSFVDKLLAGNPVICLSSYPTDARAKYAALHLMDLATDKYEVSRSRRVKGKSAPLWHRVYGGYGDSIIDRMYKGTLTDKDYPCFLVISNIPDTSTPIKMEKVRDLLDIYSDIPRVVVTSPTDPFSFMSKRLQYKTSLCLWLGQNVNSVVL